MNISKPDPNQTWVILATFDTQAQTPPLVSVLEKAGVSTRIRDERKLQRFWLLARQQAGVHVEIPENSLVAARELVQSDPDARTSFAQAIHCPSCDSSRVQYPQMTRKNYLPTLAAHVLIALHVMEHECYCEDCHFSWVRGIRSKPRPVSQGAKPDTAL